MKLPDQTVGVSSPALRRERNPAEAENLLRVHPQAYAHGFPRRGIKIKQIIHYSAFSSHKDIGLPIKFSNSGIYFGS